MSLARKDVALSVIAAVVALVAGAGVAFAPSATANLGGGALVAALAVVLYGLVVIGLKTRGILGALLLVQAGYWILSFVIRPLVLLAVEPKSRFGDPIADSRLAASGYSIGLVDVLTPVLVGLFTYTVFMAFAANRAQGWKVRVALDPVPLYVLLGVGWLFRVGQLASPDSSLLITFSFIGSVAAGGLILLTEKRPSTKLILALAATEFAWSYLSAVKAPIFAVVLWIAIRQIVDNRKFPIKPVLGLIGLAAISFVAIQNAKIAIGRLDDDSLIERFYPPFLQPLLPVITRFDLLNAATDAGYAGKNVWMSPGEALTIVLQAFVPQQISGVDKGVNIGRLWGSEVSKLSNPAVTGETFLAQNPAAEGWVISGWTGVIVECLIVAVVVIGVAYFLHSQVRYLALLGLAMTSQPYIFERGVLGIAEGAGKSLQIALIATVVIAVFRRRTVARKVGPTKLPVPA